MEQYTKNASNQGPSAEQALLSRIHEAAEAAAAVPAAGEQAGREHGAPFVQAAREEAEMKAAVVLAKKFPRDEAAAYTRIMRACDRQTFAESANYAFPRGGQTVTGPSVDLARELARIWGNIRYGLRIVTEDDERVHIKGYAYDLESNAYVETEDKFAKLVQRRNKVTRQSEWIKPDERDLRELVNKRGAICVRNAILQLLPSDIVMDAMARCRDTVQKAARGEIQQDRDAALRRLALAYHDIGVNSEMIAGYLKHPIELITNEEIADLRAIYKSIRDGNSRREEYFTLPAYHYGRTDEQRERPWLRRDERQQRHAPRSPQDPPRSSPAEPARRDNGSAPPAPTPRQEGQWQRQTAPGGRPQSRPSEPPRQAADRPAPATDKPSVEWDRIPGMDLGEPESSGASPPAKHGEPREPARKPSSGGQGHRAKPASDDPALQQARQNMEHALGQARQQAQRPGKPAAPGTAAEESADEPWQEVSEQAAAHWDTDDDRAVLRRLNRAAVSLFQTPFKKLTSEQLAQILTRVNEGEIVLE